MTRHAVAPPATLTPEPSRLVIYAVFGKDGEVDEFVIHSLAALRSHAETIFVVVNGALTPSSRARLQSVSDEILVRDNAGFDIGAQRAALLHLGRRISDFDEIILTNDTWYGPVRPWQPVFSRMDARPCHFWGLTDHRAGMPNPLVPRGTTPYHLQSYWIAVRRSLFESPAWATYWRNLPALDTYVDAVVQHELRFTSYFTSAGWVDDVAFPADAFASENPSLFEAESLIKSGCPALKRRPLFHWPPLLDSYGSVGAWTLAAAAETGYPTDLILENLARTVPPKAMNVDLGLLTVLPADDTVGGTPLFDAPRLLVVVHADSDGIDLALTQISELPGGCDLIVTITDPESHQSVSALLARSRPSDRLTEIRVVPTGASAQSAFLVGCRDVLVSGTYDFVIRLAVPEPAHAGTGDALVRQRTGDHTADAAFVSAMVGLLASEPSLGIVYPVLDHIGNARLGKSWGDLRPEFARTAASLTITVPMDDVSPLAPLDGLFAARPEAMRLLWDRPWTYDDFESAPDLASTLARMPSYAAGQLGYYTRTVVSREYLSVSHPLLEYELAELSRTIPGRSFEKIDFLRHSGWLGTGSGRDLFRMYLRRRHFWLFRILGRVADPRRFPGRLRPGHRTT